MPKCPWSIYSPPNCPRLNHWSVSVHAWSARKLLMAQTKGLDGCVWMRECGVYQKVLRMLRVCQHNKKRDTVAVSCGGGGSFESEIIPGFLEQLIHIYTSIQQLARTHLSVSVDGRALFPIWTEIKKLPTSQSLFHFSQRLVNLRNTLKIHFKFQTQCNSFFFLFFF